MVKEDKSIKSVVYVLNEILYEYNDNTYDRDGSLSIKVYRTKEEAQEAAVGYTIIQLENLDYPRDNYAIDPNALELVDISNKVNLSPDDIDQHYSDYYEKLPKEQKIRIAKNVSHEFYEISQCEIVGGKYGIGFDQPGE